MEFYNIKLKEVFSKLKSSEEGLTHEEADKRLKEYGYNEIKKEEKNKPMHIFLRQFKAFVVWVLIIAALISLFINHSIEFLVIAVIVVFVIFISFFEEYKASKDMEALIELTPKKAIVIRDNKKEEILAKDVTIGDILVLKRGDIVAADGRLLEANVLKIDESALTGESLPILKEVINLKESTSLAQQKNMIFAGTNITNGDGLAVVVNVGKNTEVGKISTMIKDIVEETTPLQKRLDRLTKQISLGVILLAIIV